MTVHGKRVALLKVNKICTIYFFRMNNVDLNGSWLNQIQCGIQIIHLFWELQTKQGKLIRLKENFIRFFTKQRRCVKYWPLTFSIGQNYDNTSLQLFQFENCNSHGLWVMFHSSRLGSVQSRWLIQFQMSICWGALLLYTQKKKDNKHEGARLKGED